MEPKERERTAHLIDFIQSAPTPYHLVNNVAERLESRDFIERPRGERWTATVVRGFVRAGDGALIAYDLRDSDPRAGFVILAAHTDSPALRVKEHGASWRKGYLSLPTEIYGGPIRSTWVDRELGMAGRAALSDGSVRPFALDSRAVIPNAAIHLNRSINEGFEYNPQDHLVALAAVDPDAGDGGAERSLRELVARALGLTVGEVVEYEVLLHDPAPGRFVGFDESMFSCGRIDNLAGCFTNLAAFLDSDGSRPRMLVLYNHEEVGSRTGEGAESDLLVGTIRRLVAAGGGDDEDVEVALNRSIVVSNDAAHALHPAYQEKYDSDYAPIAGGGPVLKLNGMYRYATTAALAARFALACEHAGVPMQRLSGRSDARSGSTVGPITWARSGIPTLDVGIPILAMHSLRETGGTADSERMIRALQALVEEDRWSDPSSSAS